MMHVLLANGLAPEQRGLSWAADRAAEDELLVPCSAHNGPKPGVGKKRKRTPK
jgi:predicted dienelactone hydrolase